jgi:hypothetical protein
MTAQTQLLGCRRHAIDAQTVEARWRRAEAAPDEEFAVCTCCAGPTQRIVWVEVVGGGWINLGDGLCAGCVE